MSRSLPAFVLAALLAAAGSLSTSAPAEAAERVAPGQEAPDFTLPSAIDAGEHHLEAARGKKDLVLVFFRGAW